MPYIILQTQSSLNLLPFSNSYFVACRVFQQINARGVEKKQIVRNNAIFCFLVRNSVILGSHPRTLPDDLFQE